MSNKKNKNIYQIHGFKHDKSIHRIWETVSIIEDNEEFLIAANNKTRVIEANGKSWYTKEPAICYFFKNYWFNVIGMLKSDGIQFYCNLSSPAVLDEEAIKYVDYDLDIKVFPGGDYKILDEDEYAKHSKKMNYPKEIMEIVEGHVDILIDMIKNKKEPFGDGFIEHWYKIYKEVK